ncbi:MAG: ATP-binding cassette domain-containing protein, partial [Clostridiales bacterium]|nr:ATP-binding cassette domain-containing protein [Clostridiales bacterium]
MPIVVKDLAYTYMKGTPYQKKALDGVSITINDGDFLGIIGATGSGKSTFIQHLNGLIRL